MEVFTHWRKSEIVKKTYFLQGQFDLNWILNKALKLLSVLNSTHKKPDQSFFSIILKYTMHQLTTESVTIQF